jgi:hypothetical protein
MNFFSFTQLIAYIINQKFTYFWIIFNFNCILKQNRKKIQQKCLNKRNFKKKLNFSKENSFKIIEKF